MDQSKIKSKVVLIALSVIVTVCLLLVISVVEIVQIHRLNQQIKQQEEQITALQNAKDYYKDKLSNYGLGENDFTFEEE